jgi:hypothetical protein
MPSRPTTGEVPTARGEPSGGLHRRAREGAARRPADHLGFVMGGTLNPICFNSRKLTPLSRVTPGRAILRTDSVRV